MYGFRRSLVCEFVDVERRANDLNTMIHFASFVLEINV